MRTPFGCSALFIVVLLTLQQQPAHAQELSVSGVSAPARDSTASEAVLHGRAAAERRGVGGRFAGGFASGFLLGLIGTAITYAIAGSDDASMPAQEAAQLTAANPTYSLAFQQSYIERLEARRRSAALTGGLIGTATVVTILLVANSSN
jgi:hypothetical protein